MFLSRGDYVLEPLQVGAFEIDSGEVASFNSQWLCLGCVFSDLQIILELYQTSVLRAQETPGEMGLQRATPCAQWEC